MINEKLIKPMLRDIGQLDISNPEHQMFAEYFIDEVSEDEYIEFKLRIDQFLDQDEEVRELLIKNIGFFTESAFPET